MLWWLIALAVLIGLALLPIGISARYNADGSQVRLMIGPFRFVLYPRPKTADKWKKVHSTKSRKQTAKQTYAGGNWTEFLPFARMIYAFLNEFRRKIRVKRLELDLVLAGEDPCDLAIRYGSVWAAVGNIMPHLERLLVIRKRKVDIRCDFAAEQTCVTARLDITITVIRALMLLSKYALRAVGEYMNIIKLRKGGASV